MEHFFEDLFLFFLPNILYSLAPVILAFGIYYILKRLLEKKGVVVSTWVKVATFIFLQLILMICWTIYFGAKSQGGLTAFLGDDIIPFIIIFVKLLFSALFAFLTQPIILVIILAFVLYKIIRNRKTIQ